jgi:hypothetical protein
MAGRVCEASYLLGFWTRAGPFDFNNGGDFC